MSIAALASLGIDDPVALVRSYTARLEDRTGFRMAAVPVPAYEPTWAERHPAKVRRQRREQQRRWRRRHLDEARAAGRRKSARWRARHLDEARKRNRDYMRRHRAKARRAGAGK